MAHPKTPPRRISPVPSTKRYDLHATALAMDMDVTPDGNRFASCPYCGGERTNQITERRFYCHHSDCGARGSAIDLVATLELELVEPDSEGRVPRLTRDQMADVRTWMTAHDIERVDVDSVTISAAKSATKGRETRAAYKPEVDTLWAAAAELPFAPPCRTFLDVRKLDRKAVAELDLARTLPDAADDVSWAKGWRRGHRLMLRVYGANGEMGAIRARWVHLTYREDRKGKKPGKTKPRSGWGSDSMTGVVR